MAGAYSPCACAYSTAPLFAARVPTRIHAQPAKLALAAYIAAYITDADACQSCQLHTFKSVILLLMSTSTSRFLMAAARANNNGPSNMHRDDQLQCFRTVCHQCMLLQRKEHMQAQQLLEYSILSPILLQQPVLLQDKDCVSSPAAAEHCCWPASGAVLCKQHLDQHQGLQCMSSPSRLRPIFAMRLLLSSSILRRGSRGKPSSRTIALSVKSMLSNWSCRQQQHSRGCSNSAGQCWH